MFGVESLSDEKRVIVANRIRTLDDFDLPELEYFNFFPCDKHTILDIRCKDCGVKPRKHQNVGAAWLYTLKKCLLADMTGTGKTVNIAVLISMLIESGEIRSDNKCLIVCRAPAVPQWEKQLQRFFRNGVKVIAAYGTQKEREAKYRSDWQVCLISHQTLINDYEALDDAFFFGLVCADDVDPLRNPESRTAYAFGRISRRSPRIIIATATPLQKRLHDMYNILKFLGGMEILGSPSMFERMYVERERVTTTGGGSENRVVRYKRLGEFKEKIQHLVLRRTVSDIDDVSMPDLIPNDIYLDMYPEQRERYADLKRGVLRIIKETGEQTKRADAMVQFNYGAQICGGLATLGEEDRPRTSAKLDWLEDKLVDGDLSDDKVVVFCMFKNTVRALQARLARGGVGFTTIWGEDKSPESRLASQEKFWDDPDCKVLIGTTAIEQSLNLQCARHLVNVDHILNFARMTQVAGRIMRDGSAHATVYVHNLYMAETQEARYNTVLAREQATSNFVLGDVTGLYPSLSPLEMLTLVGGTYE